MLLGFRDDKFIAWNTKQDGAQVGSVVFYYSQEVAHMKMKDHLTKEQQKQLGVKKENLSHRDVEDLMDKHKPTYKRHRGAVRRK